MDTALKLALGIVLGALAIGLVGFPALAQTGLGNMMGNGAAAGMMGSGANSGHRGMMGGMMNANGNFDMNAMHRAMHGEDAGVDMNQMHARMMSGNLTEEDIEEMEEHCPMMR